MINVYFIVDENKTLPTSENLSKSIKYLVNFNDNVLVVTMQLELCIFASVPLASLFSVMCVM